MISIGPILFLKWNSSKMPFVYYFMASFLGGKIHQGINSERKLAEIYAWIYIFHKIAPLL